MRILVADDDEFSREMICHLLEKEGYEVATAADGQQALERIRQQDIRLVISDWEMPRRSGVELCRAIRAEELASYVYVILVTCRNSSAEIVEGMEAGADDFIPKPFQAAELLARLRAGERLLSLETREMTIFALAKLTESRDPETGYHLERVQNYSRVLALQLATVADYAEVVDPEFVRLLYLTSPLHDIGKVGIPDSVLLKPDRLSDEEFAIMKTHTTLGAQTLELALKRYPGARFLEIARDIAATHHERYDGKGYPAGLAGTAIPMAGRIVAVADVYDALTSKRVYKGAMEHSVAKAIIVKESGRQFDPAVIDAFLAAEDQFIQIRARFADAGGTSTTTPGEQK